MILNVECQAATEQTDSNDTTKSDIAPPTAHIEEIATTSEDRDSQLITSNVNVEPDITKAFCVEGTVVSDTTITPENTDPVLDTVALDELVLESNRIQVKNSLLSTNQAPVLDTVEKQANDDTDVTSDTNTNLSSLDAALDNLTDQVASLLDENSAANVKSNSPDAPLDEALATLNSEVLGLLKESRKIQDELKKANDTKESGSKSGSKSGSVSGSRSGLNQATDKNQFFDYSLYRERSISPPPHPLITYRWEDIRRDKEKVNHDSMSSIDFNLKMEIFI